jgi:hypothetical protein
MKSYPLHGVREAVTLSKIVGENLAATPAAMMPVSRIASVS